MTDSSLIPDRYDRARESLWGTPGFQRRNSTIKAAGWSFIPQATWVVETIKTDDTCVIFLETVGSEGGQRIVLPEKVAQAIYRQHESIIKSRRKARAQRGAETRRKKQGS